VSRFSGRMSDSRGKDKKDGGPLGQPKMNGNKGVMRSWREKQRMAAELRSEERMTDCRSGKRHRVGRVDYCSCGA